MNQKTNKNFVVDIGVAPNFQIQAAMIMMMMMMILSRLNMSITVDYILFVVKK